MQMSKEWSDSLDMIDLRELADHLWLVEEIPMARIQELCDDHVIDCYKFNSLWIKLLENAIKFIKLLKIVK